MSTTQANDDQGVTEQGPSDLEGSEGTGSGMDDSSGGGKVQRSFTDRALGDLKSARKSLGRDWTKTDERFEFFLAQAKVLALLDLADAIRSGNSK